MNTDTRTDKRSESSHWVRTGLVCAGLVALGIVILFVIYNTEPEAKRDGAVRRSASLVDVTQAERGDFRPIIEAMGTVRPAREIQLSARVQGSIESLGPSFVPGGFVEAGEVLVTIDDEDYQVAFEQSQSALEQAISELEIEQAQRTAAEAEYSQFDRDLSPQRRSLVLREPQGRAARATVDSARADVRQAELNLDRTTVEAPFDAHVLDRQINLGSQVSSGTPLGRLVGVDTYWVEASLPVAQLQWLALPDEGQPGSPVTVINPNAWPQGAVRQGEVFRLIGALEGETRLARVLVAVKDPLARGTEESLPRLMLGEYVTCRIEGLTIRDVVRLERDFLREGDTVWLMVDGQLEIRPVSVVFEDDRYAYIREGLREDEDVVTTRLATIQEGLNLRTGDSTGGVASDDSASDT